MLGGGLALKRGYTFSNILICSNWAFRLSSFGVKVFLYRRCVIKILYIQELTKRRWCNPSCRISQDNTVPEDTKQQHQWTVQPPPWQCRKAAGSASRSVGRSAVAGWRHRPNNHLGTIVFPALMPYTERDICLSRLLQPSFSELGFM